MPPNKKVNIVPQHTLAACTDLTGALDALPMLLMMRFMHMVHNLRGAQSKLYSTTSNIWEGQWRVLHESVKASISDLFVFHLGENGGCVFGGRYWAPLAGGEVLMYK